MKGATRCLFKSLKPKRSVAAFNGLSSLNAKTRLPIRKTYPCFKILSVVVILKPAKTVSHVSFAVLLIPGLKTPVDNRQLTFIF